MDLGEKKKNKVKPTIMQRRVFEIYLREMAKEKPMKLGKMLLEAGYSKRLSRNPALAVFNSRGWAELKKELDGEGAKKAFNDLVAESNEDKRTRLASAIEITKIQGGYPAQENKVIGFFGDLEKLRKTNDIRPEDTTGDDSIPSSSGTDESSGV